MKFRGGEVRGEVVLSTLCVVVVGAVLAAASIGNPSIVPLSFRDFTLLFSGVMIGFVSLTFDELFVRSPERVQTLQANKQLGMGNLAKMRNAFNLGRLLESKLEYLTVTEGEMKPKYVDPEVLLGLAGDFGLADKVKEILDKSRSAPNPELYNSARALLGNFMAMHNPEQVTAAASAGFVLNSLLVPEDSIVVATGFDLGPLRSRVGEVLRASFASPRLVENVQAQITALDSSQGDLARHSAFASLLICVFEHLDTDDCTAAKKISECMSSCNVRSDKFLEESNNLLEYYRDYHLAKSEGRRGAVLGGGRNAQS